MILGHIISMGLCGTLLAIPEYLFAGTSNAYTLYKSDTRTTRLGLTIKDKSYIMLC